jgi:N utilization substance protein B
LACCPIGYRDGEPLGRDGKVAGLPMSKRRKAREIALQVLYAVDVSHVPWEVSLAETLERRKSVGEAAEYAERLIQSVVDKLHDLDKRVSGCLENWEFKRVSLIDRNIIRIALAELLFFPDTPKKVIINEAIELAHKYSSRDAGRFVNGVIDRLAGEVRGN